MAATMRALIVGINYKGLSDRRMHLSGCVNDSKNILSYLARLLKSDATAGAKKLEVCLLCDEALDFSAESLQILPERNAPTRANIQRGLEWLTRDATAHSKLFFAYSGHGTSVFDIGGDEKTDRKDECLVPLDHSTEGLIIDDDLRARVANVLPRGAQLFCWIDACHSATMFDLRVQVQDISTLKSTAKTSTAPLSGKNSGLANLPFVKSQWRRTQKRTVIDEKNACVANVVTISGCRDPQTSADAKIAGSFSGAMSFALLRAINADPDASLFDLLQQTSVWLRLNGYEQQPVLSFSSEQCESDLADAGKFRIF